MTGPTAEPIVRFENIVKRFPGIVALKGVSLSVRAGSCHGLVGENGAGKSTLGKILAGIHPYDEGKLYVNGAPVRFGGPEDALRAGVAIVHQELAFCENLSVAENLCLQRLPARGPFLSRPRLFARSREMLQSIGADIDPARRLGELPIGQQQLVQIASAVSMGARAIVFDEPTSSLSQTESERLFAMIRDLRANGVACIYVSHRLPEIFRLCDDVTVLRDGEVAATLPASELTEDRLVEMMIGRRLEEYFPEHLQTAPGEELLRVERLSSPGKFHDVSFTLAAGETLGFAGLVGAGRTELAEALFGLDPHATGKVFVRGNPVRLGSPQRAIRLGMGLVPEDRKRHGLTLSMTARENLTLPILDRLSTLGFVKIGEERNIAETFFTRMRVRAGGMDVPAAAFSGGNQQKVVLARWLAADCKILFLDEPTRGVDVGAKAEIHALIDRLVREGAGVLLISSELPEVLNLSTRIIVLRNGRAVREVSRQEASQDYLLRLMAGIPANGARAASE